MADISFYNRGSGIASASPAIQAIYAKDPRVAAAAKLLDQGSSDAPVDGLAGGFGRLAKALVGGYQQGQLNQDYQARDNSYRDTLANALKMAQPQAAETKTYAPANPVGPDGPLPSQTINWKAREGGYAPMAAALAGNPDTAPMGLDIQLKNIDAQQTQAAELAKETRQHDYESSKPVNLGQGAKLINPKTGAVLAEGAPKNEGISIGYDEQGRQLIDINGGGNPTRALQKSTQGALEKDAIDTSNTMLSTKRAIESVEKNMAALTLGNKVKNGIAGIQAAFDPGSLTPEQKNRMMADTKTRSDIVYNVAKIAHDLLGAAQTPTERASIEPMMPGPNDDPFTSLAKMKAAYQRLDELHTQQRGMVNNQSPFYVAPTSQGQPMPNLDQGGGLPPISGAQVASGVRGPSANPITLTHDADGQNLYQGLPRGAQYIDPTGQVRTKQ